MPAAIAGCRFPALNPARRAAMWPSQPINGDVDKWKRVAKAANVRIDRRSPEAE
jgi:hypothetical protein